MLNNKSVLVTGGAKGIGKAIALAFAAQGANVAINYNSTPPDETLKEIEAFGVKALALPGNVADFEQAQSLVKQTKEAFGSLDVLVNNAGITKDGLIMRMSEADFAAVVDINLKGAFNTIRHASPIMIKQKSGCMINISSVIGVMGNAGQANYAASKAGIIGLTKSVAKELGARGITVNAIAPGFIETEMTAALPEDKKAQMLAAIPLNRYGQASEVGDLAVFLAKSTYITGQVICLDGGLVM